VERFSENDSIGVRFGPMLVKGGSKRMKQFTIKSEQSSPSVLELIDEIENGFYVRIRRDRDGSVDVKDEFMSRELFDTCLRTGYLAEFTAASSLAAETMLSA
jgi:hypothetical protein